MKGGVVLIKGDEKNRRKWNIGIFQHINKGKDGNIRSIKLRYKKAILQRAIQHLYPIELTCSSYTAPKEVILDPNTRVFSPNRNAAVAANERIKKVAQYETELPDVEQYLLLLVSNRGRVFERTRTFSTGIINIRLEHGAFFKLLLHEEVPRNF